MNGRLSIWEPLHHIKTHQHLKKNDTNSVDVALTSVQEGRFILNFSGEPISMNKMGIQGENDEALPCFWDLIFVWYNWCMWPKRVGSMEIEESCMIRHFTEFDNFWLPNTVSRCQSNASCVDAC